MSRGRGQRGRAKATIDLIETSIKIIEACQPITVRGVCYKLFVAGLIESMAVKNTQKVSRILRDAREEGRIPWEWIVDDSRELEDDYGWADLSEYARAVERGYHRDFWAFQDTRLIVISEKSTVAGTIRPVLREYGVPFFAAHGFNSATKVYEIAQRIQGDDRHYIFLYIGDYDPSGLFMSEVDFVERLQKYGAKRFDFIRIALTKDDTINLPSFDVDTKQKDPRYPWFVSRYGRHAWELDAMDPVDLRNRIRDQIVPYVPSDEWERHKLIEEAERQTTKMIAARLAEMAE
jgi:hypothetical protein